MNRLANLRQWENRHIALWLLKDTCWLLDYEAVAMLMAGPTISLAIWITWQYRQSWSDMAHNAAVCCWISGNIVWMTGEFFFNDNWRSFAQWFFFAGLGVVAVYYAGQILAKKAKNIDS
jgi:uncharacterized membrane protein YraQ (UPF0718 family)